MNKMDLSYLHRVGESLTKRIKDKRYERAHWEGIYKYSIPTSEVIGEVAEVILA